MKAAVEEKGEGMLSKDVVQEISVFENEVMVLGQCTKR